MTTTKSHAAWFIDDGTPRGLEDVLERVVVDRAAVVGPNASAGRGSLPRSARRHYRTACADEEGQPMRGST